MSGMPRIIDAKGVVDTDVHYASCALIGSGSLCGHTDRLDADFQQTVKRVTCKACIAVRDYVLGKAWR